MFERHRHVFEIILQGALLVITASICFACLASAGISFPAEAPEQIQRVLSDETTRIDQIWALLIVPKFIALLGYSKWALRLPYALAAFSCAGLVVCIGRLFSKSVAFCAAAIFVSSPFFVLTSRLAFSAAPDLLAHTLVGAATFYSWMTLTASGPPYGWPVARSVAVLAVSTVLGVVSLGILKSVFPPLLAVTCAQAMYGRSRTSLVLSSLVALCLVSGLFVLFSLQLPQQWLWVRGPVGGRGADLGQSLALLFHRFAPFTALVPCVYGFSLYWLSFDSSFAKRKNLQGTKCFLALLLWPVFDFIRLVFSGSSEAPNAFLAVAPLCIVIAWGLINFHRIQRSRWACVVIMLAGFVLLIRDSRLYPLSWIQGMPFQGNQLPIDLGAIFFPATFAVCALSLALGQENTSHTSPTTPLPRFSATGYGNYLMELFSARATLLVVMLLIPSYVIFVWLKEAAQHWSLQEQYRHFQRYAKPSERFAHYRVSASTAPFYLDDLSKVIEKVDDPMSYLSAPTRRWILMPRESFAEVNSAFFHQQGQHLYVDAFGTYVLAANLIFTAHNANPLAQAVFRKMPAIPNRLSVDFESSIELLGYSLASQSTQSAHDKEVESGTYLRFTWYYRALQKLWAPWRVFIHIEPAGGGPPIIGDHDPVQALYPTNLWEAGDIIVDRHEVLIPSYTSPGKYRVFLGFYSGPQRMRINSGSNDGNSRTLVTSIRVR